MREQAAKAVDEQPEVLCTLSADDASDRVDEWREIRRQALAVSSDSGVTRMMFPLVLERRVRELAVRERACCSFLRLLVEVDQAGCHLEIRSVEPSGDGVVTMLAVEKPNGCC